MLAGFNAPTAREVWVVGAVPKCKTLCSVCTNHQNGWWTSYPLQVLHMNPTTGIMTMDIGTHGFTSW